MKRDSFLWRVPMEPAAGRASLDPADETGHVGPAFDCPRLDGVDCDALIVCATC